MDRMNNMTNGGRADRFLEESALNDIWRHGPQTRQCQQHFPCKNKFDREAYHHVHLIVQWRIGGGGGVRGS